VVQEVWDKLKKEERPDGISAKFVASLSARVEAVKLMGNQFSK
jgi:hypothetical protein